MDTWDRVQQLFLSAADLGPNEKSQFLAAIADPKIRAEVEAMLRADSEAAETISSAVENEAAMLLESPALTGDRLGSYRLIRQIGRGGMGVVFLATRDDDQFQKQVAIKIVKPGMDTAEVLGRFRYERQILANLDHPYIAKLLDGGTTPEGRPFFVMDYVEGHPVDEFCHGLNVRERCELFLKVCEAVAHAHRNLIVHRDLKPANIFVTADGTPKLLDFGVAKILSEHDRGLTRTAAHRPLTPEYASPEQIRGLAVNTTTDIYSLGAILYELLTEQRAHSKTTTRDELERAICEKELERPSTLRRGLDPDLDNIVLMAMRKEPERRYQSVDQFADDVRRYLSGWPVLARQDSYLYRARKFVSRNRFQLAAAALVFASLLIGLFAAVSKSREAETARQLAVAERARAEAESHIAQEARSAEARERGIAAQERDDAVQARIVAERRLKQLIELSDKSLFDIHNAIENLPGALTARQQLVRATLDFLEHVEKEQGMDDNLRLVLSSAYYKIARIQGDTHQSNIGDFAGSLRSLHRADDLLHPLYNRKPPNPEVVFRYVSIQDALASAALESGNWKGAVSTYESLLPVAHRLGSMRNDDANFVKQEAAVHSKLASLYEVKDDAIALMHAKRQVELMAAIVDRFPNDAGLKSELAVGYGQVSVGARDLEEAAAYLEKSIAVREELVRQFPANLQMRRGLMINYGNYAALLGIPWTPNLGRYDEAREYAAKTVALGREMAKADPQNQNARYDLAAGLTRLGSIPPNRGKERESLAALNEAVAILETFFKANPKSERFASPLAEAFEYSGHRHRELGELDAAEGDYRRSLELVEAIGTRQGPSLQIQGMASEEALAEFFASTGRRAEALDFANRAIARAEKNAKDPGVQERMVGHVGRAYFELASVERTLGDPERSREAAAHAIESWSALRRPRLITYYRPLIEQARKWMGPASTH